MKLLNGVGLGTFPFANPFSKVDSNQARSIIKTFFKNGGEYIDTSPTYAYGEVEALLGKILKEYRRDSFFINSSCGFIRNGNSYIKSGRYNDVIRECEKSLKRLGLNELDMYISHTPDTETGTPFSETIHALETLKKQGKVKAIGVSNVNLDQLKEYNSSGSIQFIQNRFSLLNQNFEKEFIAYCKEQDIGIIAFQVIERGLLTSKFIHSINQISPKDLRMRKPEFQKKVVTVITNWVEKYLYPIAQKNNLPLPTLAIIWALAQDYISLCQCGATKPTQVEDNLKASKYQSEKIIQEIDLAYDILTQSLLKEYQKNVISFMGISIDDTLKGSSTGK
ncbi:MAG: aldo/keto reductase [Balneola sp.]